MTTLLAVQIIDCINDSPYIDGINDDTQHHYDYVEAMQCLIDTGTIYHLQGSYQRLAQDMLDGGLVTSLFNHI